MIKGIDVSSYQSETPSLTGFDFCFVKATEGTGYVNPRMDEQADHARAAGLVVGFYHFVRPGDIKRQAAYFVQQADSLEGDILWLDWEDPGVSSADKDTFLAEVKRLRGDTHRVGLYCSRSYWTTRDKSSNCGDALWIAEYGVGAGHPNIEAAWLFHQYTDSPVDTSVGAFTTRAALRAWATKHEQEDPMAGITKQDIFDAVWKTDQVAGPADAADHKSNPNWQPQSILKDVQARVRAMQAGEAAQTAAITKLAGLVGTGVDTATVVAEVKAAIADAVVKVSVDVTGQEA